MNEERDVIGEVIAEDNARPIHPAVAEYAVQALHTATSDGDRVAELELLNKELWRQNEAQAQVIANRDAQIAEYVREIERLTYSNSHNFECVQKLLVEKAALKAQPSGVVLPGRIPYETPGSEYFHGYNAGWAGSLDEVARLNSSPVSAGDGMCNADNPAARCICREEFGRRVCAGGVDERAAFEAGLNPHCRRRNEHGEYVVAQIQDRWEGWQARAALNAGSAVPDGWKVVPLEATTEMVDALKARISCTSRGGILNAGNALNDAIAAAPTAKKEG